MHVFSIRDIENLTGIKAHTLRIWEQRYNFLQTKRRDSNHRFYDHEDLKNILRIAYLYKKGIKISKIAGLGTEEIRQHALSSTSNENEIDITINNLTEAVIDFDEPAFEKILSEKRIDHGMEHCVLKIMFPLLNKLGLLWLSGDIRPAQEHFASALIIKQILISTQQLIHKPYISNRCILIFTPPGEFHEIPILFMQYLLKRNGIRYVFAGKNTGLETLKEFCMFNEVTELYLHLITNLLHCDVNSYLQRLYSAFPQMKIFISGSSLLLEQMSNPHVHVLKTSQEIMSYASSGHV